MARPPRLLLLGIAIPALFIFSCEDAELTAKRDSQQIELLDLEQKFAVLQRETSREIPDRTQELEATLHAIDSVSEEISQLELEIAELKTAQALEEAKLREFKARYPIRSQ